MTETYETRESMTTTYAAITKQFLSLKEKDQAVLDELVNVVVTTENGEYVDSFLPLSLENSPLL